HATGARRSAAAQTTTRRMHPAWPDQTCLSRSGGGLGGPRLVERPQDRLRRLRTLDPVVAVDHEERDGADAEEAGLALVAADRVAVRIGGEQLGGVRQAHLLAEPRQH